MDEYNRLVDAVLFGLIVDELERRAVAEVAPQIAITTDLRIVVVSNQPLVH